VFVDVAKYLREGETDATGFLERCVEAGVLLTPGQASGKDYASWTRLCFTTLPPDELRDALAKLKTVMK
jgi:N-succinyldiaminopimelate aminotransferase